MSTKLYNYEDLYNEDNSKSLTREVNFLGGMEVQLVDFSPNMCPKGMTPEYRIAQAARTSFGNMTINAKADAGLIRYLLQHQHTSPSEMCSATFRVKVPKFVAVQLLRHRTAKFMHVNEFSQRYATSSVKTGMWDPLSTDTSLRTQSKTNKQGSMDADEQKKIEIRQLMEKANKSLDVLYTNYNELVEAGCANEIARSYLPMCEYTIMFIQFDLNNLLKFLTLRDDVHAQYETQQLARHMHSLAEQVFPITFSAYSDFRQAITFDLSEINHLNGSKELKSKSSLKALNEKMTLIGDVRVAPGIPKAAVYTPPPSILQVDTKPKMVEKYHHIITNIIVASLVGVGVYYFM